MYWMSLQHIKINDTIADIFIKAYQHDRVSHAYLFVGKKGIGKTFASYQLVKFFNCVNHVLDEHQKPIDCCDQCEACHKIDHHNHPDIKTIELAKDSSSIKIDQIKTISDFLCLKPYEGRKKVVLVEQAGAMTIQAQNALLKILEEPPSNSLLILMTESVHDLVSTIVSRTQVVRFLPVDSAKIAAILEEDFGVCASRIPFLCRICEGSLGRALENNEQEYLTFREDILQECVQNPFLENIEIDKLSRQQQQHVLQVMESFYRDIMVYKLTQDQNTLINIDHSATIEKLAFSHQMDTIIEVLSLLGDLQYKLSTNANAKLVFSVLAGKLLCG